MLDNIVLKTYQEEALTIAREIWKADVKKGRFVYYKGLFGSEPNLSLPSYIPEEYAPTFLYKSSKTLRFLEKLGYVVLKDNPSILAYSLHGCMFEVAENITDSPYEKLTEDIVNASTKLKDKIIGNYEGMEVKASGNIFYNKVLKGSLSPKSKQFLLLKALLSPNNINKYMTVEMILNYLDLPVPTDPTLILPVKTYENLNQVLKKYEIPIHIKKHENSYMLEKEIPLK